MNFNERAKSAVQIMPVGISKSADVGEIASAAQSLSQEVTELHNWVESLSNRLTPILRPSAAENTSSPPRAYETPMGVCIGNEVYNVQQVNKRLQEIIGRIEL